MIPKFAEKMKPALSGRNRVETIRHQTELLLLRAM